MERIGNCNREKVQSQATTEYILMLAVVIGIAAIGIYFLFLTQPAALIDGFAAKDGDNVVFTPSNSMVPADIPAADWEYSVYRGSDMIKNWRNGSVKLARGMPVTLPAEGNEPDDVLKIRYKGAAVFDTLIK